VSEHGGRTLATREVYKGRVVHLVVDEVVLPNGHQMALEVIHHPGAAAVVPFVTPDEILLVRQYRHAAGGFLLEVPAGKLDAGEPPEVCARRETEEEVGWTVGTLTALGPILTTPGFTDEVIHLFAAHDLRPSTARPGLDEVLSVVRMPLLDALEAIERGAISDAKSVCAILLAERRFRRR